MKKFNTFVRYHGCNIGYKDGTRQIIFKTCSRPTRKPFWKNPEHVTSRVAKSTRAQLKNKPLAYKKDLKNYINRFNLGHSSEAKRVLEWVSNYSSSESYTGSDSDYYSDTNSLPDTNYYKMSNLTGDNLIIDIKPEPEPEPDNKISELETNPQNPENKKQKIPADNAL